MLKRPVLAVTLVILATFSAFSYANEHQQMMEGMMKFQRCLSENVDEQALSKIAAEGEKMEQQITQLCQAGKRKQAQDTAIDYAKKMLEEPSFKAMQACVAQVGSSFPGAADFAKEFDLEELEKTHICDELDS